MWLSVYTLAYFCIPVHNIITSYHSIFNNHFEDLEGLWCRGTLNQTSTKGLEDFPINKHRQRSITTTWIRGYDPLDMVSLILVERHPPIQSSPIKDVDRSSISNISCVYPARLLKTCIHISCTVSWQVFPFRFPYSPTVYFSRDGSREGCQRDPGSKRSTSRNVLEPVPGARRS